MQLQKLKEPTDDFKQMVQAALDACSRRRALVQKYYEIRMELESVRQCLQGQQSKELEAKLLDLKKRAEAMTEEVAMSAKILDEEIKVFRKAKEADMQKLMIDFVQI